jgi:hypothetical protein
LVLQNKLHVSLPGELHRLAGSPTCLLTCLLTRSLLMQLAHRMHRPQEVPLHDAGFEYLPELGLENAWVSETIFWSLFIPFVLWSFSPFVTARKRFYTAVIYARILVVLSLCQFLRIISFTGTMQCSPVPFYCPISDPCRLPNCLVGYCSDAAACAQLPLPVGSSTCFT